MPVSFEWTTSKFDISSLEKTLLVLMTWCESSLGFTEVVL